MDSIKIEKAENGYIVPYEYKVQLVCHIKVRVFKSINDASNGREFHYTFL